MSPIRHAPTSWPVPGGSRALLCAWLMVAIGGVAVVTAPGIARAAAASEVQVAPAARSERLALILRRGSLIVGVKTDYPPFGTTDGASASHGFEHDLAAEIARRLGVGLNKVGVSATNRLQRLQDGSIDLVIATTGDTGERRRIVTMVEPNYYASGVTLFMPPHERAKDWPDIRGKTVCGTQGAYFNRTMQERYLFDLALYTNPRDARLAVKNGRCIGFLFDNTAVVGSLAQPEWHGWHAPLPPALNTPWAMAIAAEEKGSELERRLGDIVAEWHRSGWLIEREQAWGIPPSRFLAEMHALWRGTDAEGAPLCRRGADGNWLAQCRNSVFVTSAEVTGLARLGRLIQERSGVDLVLLYDPYDRGRFLRGIAFTLVLTLACVLGSLACGIGGALAAESRWSPLRWAAHAACTLGRMTPPLLTIYLVLFGIGAALALQLAAAPVVVACLSVYTGAGVMTALLEALPVHRRSHPAFILRWSNVRRLAPLASGSVTAALINVSKATMLASAVAVPELLSVATAIISDHGNAGVVMNLMLLAFVLIIVGTVRLLHRIERRILEAERDGGH